MSIELVPVLCPLAATMAVVCGARWRHRRRRVAVNRALHELRRPLQALALGQGVSASAGSGIEQGSLDLALLALDDLDGAINGRGPSIDLRPVCARSLAAAAVDRWRVPAARQERSLSLEWRAGKAFVQADHGRISQALDNLIANAIEHGGLRIRVGAAICAAGLRLTVSDGGAAPRRSRRHGPRRGHGLEVVRRVAEAHGGRFRLESSGSGTVAVLELPLVAAPLAAGPIAQMLHERTAPARDHALPNPRPSRSPASPTAA